jgi:hypothetical protein
MEMVLVFVGAAVALAPIVLGLYAGFNLVK